MMRISSSAFAYKLQHLVSCLIYKFFCFCKSTCFLITYFYQHILLRIDPFLIQFFYFLFISTLGFSLLALTKPRASSVDKPTNLDLFYTSVSAMTTSSMSTVEMEFFFDNQLVVLAFLMLVGGEIFTSMIGLHFSLMKLRRTSKDETKVDASTINLSSSSATSLDQIELGTITVVPDASEKPKVEINVFEIDSQYLKYNSIHFLAFVVLGYFLLNHIIGFIVIPIYLAIFPSTKNMLKKKGLSAFTFSVFTTISTFSGCGFLPNNENMVVFNKNTGLLLILIPQVLLGNTLYPSCLRFCVWFLGKFFKKAEAYAKYLLTTSSNEICYFHWLSARHSLFLVFTVVGFTLVQFVMFCSMEWNSDGLSNLNYYERFVAAIFQAVNTRHAGETIVDLSKIAPALWVLFVLMMLVLFVEVLLSHIG